MVFRHFANVHIRTIASFKLSFHANRGIETGLQTGCIDQIVMSQWSVPDRETSELMRLFYGDLSSTLNPVVSYQHAQS
jgi:hypothetical protein